MSITLNRSEVIECAERRAFYISKEDADDIIKNWATEGESVESAVCSWLLNGETCDPDLEKKFGLPDDLFI